MSTQNSRPFPRTPANAPKRENRPLKWTREGKFYFRLEVLTPVFIGSGEVFSPIEYAVIRDGNIMSLWVIDLQAWFREALAGSHVGAPLLNGNLAELHKSIQNSSLELLKKVCLAQIPFHSEKLGKDLAAPERQGQGLIQSFIGNPLTNTPFIPGSSLKGALSTPLINALNNRLNPGNRLRDRSNALSGMFGEIKDHSMKAMKIADISLPVNSTFICEAEEIAAPNWTGKKTSKDPCEALKPGTKAYCRISLDCSGEKPGIALKNGDILGLEELRSYCNDFYRGRFEKELDRFYRQPKYINSVKLAEVASRLAGLEKSGQFLLRVGHYSHIEAVTVDENKPKAPYGNTRTLANNEHPFGWVMLVPCTEKEYREGHAGIEEGLEKKVAAKFEMMKQAEKAAAAVIEAEKQRKEADDRRKQEREQAAAKQAFYEKLDANGKLIVRCGREIADANDLAELYRLLDQLEGERKKHAAKLLRKHWEKEGKWKKAKKNQKERVDKVKAILGIN